MTNKVLCGIGLLIAVRYVIVIVVVVLFVLIVLFLIGIILLDALINIFVGLVAVDVLEKCVLNSELVKC